MAPADCAQRLAEALSMLVQGLASVDGSARRASPRVLVADSLARYWMMSPPPGLRSLAELQAVAQAHCDQTFGSSQRWRLGGDWSARRRFLCAAVPEWVVTGVRAGLGARASLAATLPTLLASSAASLAPDGWTCVLLPGRINLLSTVGGSIHSLRSLAAQAGSDLTELLSAAAQELQRESLRHGIAVGGSVACLCAVSKTLDVVDAAGIRFICQPIASNARGLAETDPLAQDAVLAAMLAVPA